MSTVRIAVCGEEHRVKNYLAALRAAGMEPVAAVDTELSGVCDGLVLPGGGDVDPVLYGQENTASSHIDRALDEAQLNAARKFIEAGKPVLGICKGLQLLNILFGGTLIQHIGTAEAHSWHDGDSFHLCDSVEGSVIRALYGEHFTVNSAHHQALGDMGTDFYVTGSAPDGTVEAAEHRALPVLGVQWHPERLREPAGADGEAIFSYFRQLAQANKKN